MTPHIWINGEVLPAEKARISPFDHGFLVGDGVFETLVARGGRLFATHEHWLRLERSCATVGLTPISEADCLAAMEAVLKANQLTEARVRVTLTSGEGPLGSDRGGRPGTVIVAASSLHAWPPTERVCVAPWTRHEAGALAGVKSISYGENVRALAHAKARGYGEALLANTRGELCEGTGSNVFVVVQGRLMTPPLSSGCLAGVTRMFVLRACAQAGIPCEETALPVTVLKECEEAFLTSSTRDVHPIAEVDGHAFCAPGPVTLAVQTAFQTYASQPD